MTISRTTHPLFPFFASIVLCLVSLGALHGQSVIRPGDRVVFLGDSNTYAGTWIDLLDAWQRQAQPELRLEMLNLGLPSETACGLSEPSHPFPRPDVRERLDRVLEKMKPQVVFVCYGMNDGIYHPFSDERFQKYQSSIRQVCERVRKTGAKVILLTPPPFDPLPLKARGKLASASAPEVQFSWQVVADDYDQTIQKYAKWILTQNQLADAVIDVHTPIQKALDEQRRQKPDFSFSNDGVHFDGEGHRQLAKAVLAYFGHDSELKFETAYLAQVTRRQRILRDAYLSDCGHLRPGVAAGKPLEEAESEAAKIEAGIPK